AALSGDGAADRGGAGDHPCAGAAPARELARDEPRLPIYAAVRQAHRRRRRHRGRDLRAREPRRRGRAPGSAGAARAALPAHGARRLCARAAAAAGGPGAADRDRRESPGQAGRRDHRDGLLPALARAGRSTAEHYGEHRYPLRAGGVMAMAHIISIHSFRGGTGKSNTVANLAAVLAADGLRVGVIDTDIQSPGIHILFGLAGDQIRASLNDYLWHGRDIKDTAQDVTPSMGADIAG